MLAFDRPDAYGFKAGPVSASLVYDPEPAKKLIAGDMDASQCLPASGAAPVCQQLLCWAGLARSQPRLHERGLTLITAEAGWGNVFL